MADLSDAQRKRAEARQRRRSPSKAEPQEAEASSTDGEHAPQHSVKQAAKVAAAVGAAGAAAAAARALTSHGDNQSDEDDSGREEQEPVSEGEQESKAEEPGQQEQTEAQGQEDQREDEPVAGARASDARKTIERARQQLSELLERPVESVSSLERTQDGWVVEIEVVELKRIPESTDVLASYEMELDDDLNLRRYQQVRRYTRSQADRGDGA